MTRSFIFFFVLSLGLTRCAPSPEGVPSVVSGRGGAGNRVQPQARSEAWRTPQYFTCFLNSSRSEGHAPFVQERLAGVATAETWLLHLDPRGSSFAWFDLSEPVTGNVSNPRVFEGEWQHSRSFRFNDQNGQSRRLVFRARGRPIYGIQARIDVGDFLSDNPESMKYSCIVSGHNLGTLEPIHFRCPTARETTLDFIVSEYGRLWISQTDDDSGIVRGAGGILWRDETSWRYLLPHRSLPENATRSTFDTETWRTSLSASFSSPLRWTPQGPELNGVGCEIVSP